MTMGVLTTALENLAAVTVEGVTSYALAETPEALTGAQLPALVIVPELGGAWPGLEPNGFNAGAGRLTVEVAHVLLIAPVAQGAGMRGTLPALADAIDAYVTALAGDPMLNEALPRPLRFTVRAGVVRYGDVAYHGATFVHTWMLHVA
jgi:hypothetical protein